jgi:hypothetical protein
MHECLNGAAPKKREGERFRSPSTRRSGMTLEP